jgi:hypothetical protein
MKVEKNQNPFIFLATYWNLSSKSDNLIISFLKSGKFGPVLVWKILCKGQNHFFQVKIWQNFAQSKKTLVILVINQPQEELAKFGYKSEGNVKIF